MHLIADLEQCDLSDFVPDEPALALLSDRISSALAEAGLTEVGRQFHFFGPGAVTASVCLSESHFNFHSWPEYGYVSLDLLCCATAGAVSTLAANCAAASSVSYANSAIDRESKLERLLNLLTQEIFRAGRVKKTVFFR